MNYMNDFFKMQKNMYDSFKDIYKFDQEEKGEETNSDQVGDFFDMQKNVYDFWRKAANPFDGATNYNPFDMNNMGDIMEMQQDYFQNMRKLYEGGFNMDGLGFKNFNEAFNKYRDFYSSYDMGQIFGPNLMEFTEKVYDANKFYLQMYNFWSNLNEQFIEAGNMDYKKLDEFVRKNNDIAYRMVLDMLPKEVQTFIEEPKALLDKYMNIVDDFYRPWGEDTKELRDLYVEGILKNDISKISEFFKLWKGKYDSSFGKILESPAFGVSKNITEQQNKAFDKFLEMFIISSEFSSKIVSVQRTAFKKIVDEYLNLAKEGMEAQTFEEFYDFWSKIMDKYLIDYFASEEFSKIIGKFSASVMDYRIESNKLIEDYLVDTPIVTRGELDSLIKKTYDLRKEVKALEKEIEALKKEEPKKAK